MLLPIRRLQLHEGDATELPVVSIDTETLQVERAVHRYERLAERRWSMARSGAPRGTCSTWTSTVSWWTCPTASVECRRARPRNI